MDPSRPYRRRSTYSRDTRQQYDGQDNSSRRYNNHPTSYHSSEYQPQNTPRYSRDETSSRSYPYYQDSRLQRGWAHSDAYNYNYGNQNWNLPSQHYRPVDNYGYDYGYTNNQSHNTDYMREPRRDRHKDQRRGYHSISTSRYPNNNSNTRNNEAASSSSISNIASRLFRHQEPSTPSHPRSPDYNVSSLRNRLSTRRRSPPIDIPGKEPMASGPSENYLQTSLEPSETLESTTQPPPKLLILDLNGTLVYRSPHRHYNRTGRGPNATTAHDDDVYSQFDPTQPRPLRTVHPRPYLSSFSKYLFHPDTKKWLNTMVWSSAQPHSVNDMVEKSFGSKKNELMAIWARDRLGLDQGDYGRKVQTTKDLNKPWDELPSSPEQKHSAKTTLLLDDSPLKAHLQPYNHLCIKEYDVELRKRDINVRELEVAKRKLMEGRKSISKDEQEDDDDIDEHEHDQEASSPRKRKRKEKKENKKKEKIEERLKKISEGSRGPSSVEMYDETLLCVIGILDAMRKENNVAAWVRSGGLVKLEDRASPLGVVEDEEEQTPTKKTKLSSPERGSSATPPPPSSFPPPPSSPTEETGIPLAKEPESKASLWFDHPGALGYWAERGRKVLHGLEIEVTAGVIGSTG